MNILAPFGFGARSGSHSFAVASAYLLLAIACSPADANSTGGPLFQKGLADRGAWEQWFASLQGDFKTGAFYWASQRSLPHPGSCQQMDTDFFNGCTAAKERLAPIDAMRNTEPQYKLGWNAWTPITSPAAAPAEVASPAPAPAAQAPSAAGNTDQTEASSAASNEPSATEEQFITEIDNASAAYESAPNEMAQGAVRAFRARALCSLFPDDEVNNWTGTIETLSSTNDGQGVLSIRISPHITLSTTNNTFSEALENQRTLIRVGSPLWSSVVRLSANQRVVFSGRFSTGDDCFQETSLTVGGGMADPDFVMKFLSVEPAQ